MAMVYFMDGFDQYASDPEMSKNWAASTTEGELSTTVRHSSGGKSHFWPLNRSSLLTSKSFTELETGVLGFAFMHGVTSWSPAGFYVSFIDSTTSTTQVKFVLDSAFKINCYRGSTALSITSSDIIPQAFWTFIEIKVNINSSTGSIQMKFNGRTVINETSLNTQNGVNAKFDTIGIYGPEDSEEYVDDIFISDDFIGDRHIACYSPAADTTQADWTPLSAGDNYAEVDDCPHDSDTSYNETSTDAHKDRFTIETLPTDVIGVDAVQVEAWAKLTEAGSSTLSPVLKSGATEEVETGQGLQPTYQPVTSEIYNTDPNTSAAWTKSDAQAIEIGYKFNEVV